MLELAAVALAAFVIARHPLKLFSLRVTYNLHQRKKKGESIKRKGKEEESKKKREEEETSRKKKKEKEEGKGGGRGEEGALALKITWFFSGPNFVGLLVGIGSGALFTTAGAASAATHPPLHEDAAKQAHGPR